MVSLFLVVEYFDDTEYYRVLGIVRVESAAKEIAENMGCSYFEMDVKPLSVGRNPHKKSKYPFHTLEIGESFSILRHQVLSMRSYACEVARHTGRKFSVSSQTLKVTRVL